MDLSSPKQQRILKYPEFSGELEPRRLILNIAVNFCRYVSFWLRNTKDVSCFNQTSGNLG